jgi:hypothetical protein
VRSLTRKVWTKCSSQCLWVSWWVPILCVFCYTHLWKYRKTMCAHGEGRRACV